MNVILKLMIKIEVYIYFIYNNMIQKIINIFTNFHWDEVSNIVYLLFLCIWSFLI